jgi:hypothetical protein
MKSETPFGGIRIPGVLEMIPGGQPGYDYKMILNTYDPRFHHTISIGAFTSGTTSLPIYVEKTLHTTPKAHNVFGRGSLDIPKLVSSLFPAAIPTVTQINLQDNAYRDGEWIVFTPEMLQTFSSGPLTFDNRILATFQPVPTSQVVNSDFGIAASVFNTTGSGIVVHSKRGDFGINFPPFDTIDERIERAATIRKVDEYIEGYDEDYTDDYW